MMLGSAESEHPRPFSNKIIPTYVITIPHHRRMDDMPWQHRALPSIVW